MNKNLSNLRKCRIQVILLKNFSSKTADKYSNGQIFSFSLGSSIMNLRNTKQLSSILRNLTMRKGWAIHWYLLRNIYFLWLVNRVVKAKMRMNCFLTSNLFLRTGYTAKKNLSTILESATWWWKNISRHTSIFKITIISSFLSKKPSPLTILSHMRINLKWSQNRLVKRKTKKFW